MPRIRSEEVEKQLTHFLRREVKEKRAQLGELRLFKQTSKVKRGILPSLHIKEQGITKYAVYISLGPSFRIYFFSAAGQMLGAQTFTDSNIFAELKKQSRKLYGYPPKEKKKGFEEQNQILNNTFVRILDSFATRIQIKKPKLPILSLVATGKISENEFGLRRDKELVQVPVSLLKNKPALEAMIFREVVHSCLPPFIQKSPLNEDLTSLLVWGIEKHKQKIDEEWTRAAKFRGSQKEKHEWQAILDREKNQKKLREILEYLHFLKTHTSRFSLEEIQEFIPIILHSNLQDQVKFSFELFTHLSQKIPKDRSLLLQIYFGLASNALTIEQCAFLLEDTDSSLLKLALEILNFRFEPYYKTRRHLRVEQKKIFQKLLEEAAKESVILSINTTPNSVRIKNKTDQYLIVARISYSNEAKEEINILSKQIDPNTVNTVKFNSFTIEDEAKLEIWFRDTQPSRIYYMNAV
ncbi:MAG: hypothetical protein ACFFBD_24965, partial [Candidatus Hodarchaeota archaeon]